MTKQDPNAAFGLFFVGRWHSPFPDALIGVVNACFEFIPSRNFRLDLRPPNKKDHFFAGSGISIASIIPGVEPIMAATLAAVFPRFPKDAYRFVAQDKLQPEVMYEQILAVFESTVPLDVWKLVQRARQGLPDYRDVLGDVLGDILGHPYFNRTILSSASISKVSER